MNIFDIHDQVLTRYGDYVQSFLAIAYDDIPTFVTHKLVDERAHWPCQMSDVNECQPHPIWVATTRRKRPLTIESITYRFVTQAPAKCSGFVTINLLGHPVPLAHFLA
jgi:hypothetical protein